MFDPEGGGRNYITERRALRAMLDLSNCSGERGAYRRVSERWGFSSQPNFNRIIQRIYDATPSKLFQHRITRRPSVSRGPSRLGSFFSQAVSA